jgi:moderate conductance mechanosensitive channel
MRSWIDANHDVLVATLRVAGVLVLAIALRFAVGRIIDRVAARASVTRQARRLYGGSRTAKVVSAATPWRNERQQQRTQAMASLLKSLAAVVITLVAVFMILDVLGYDLAPLLASAGVVGVALGFGAQNLVKDFLAGVCMLLEDQFGVGDAVDLEKASGTVEAVGLRVTRLRDATGVIWYVRNGEVLRVGNKSQGWSQISVDIQIAHDEDVQRATDIVNRVAAEMAADETYSGVVIDVPTVVGIEAVTGNSVMLRVLGTCATNQQFAFQRELRSRVKHAFDDDGIRVPAPTPWLAGHPSGTGAAPPR